MSNQENPLATAIACYHEWQRHLNQLPAALLGDSLAECWMELETAHQAARQADLALLTCLPSVDLEKSAAFGHYRALVTSVVEQVQTLQQRAITLKALTAAELTELRGGKDAVTGYRPAQTDAGRAFTIRG